MAWRCAQGGEESPTCREALFEEVYLPNNDSPLELEEALHLYRSQHFLAGIGEHFPTARESIGKFKLSLGVALTDSLWWRRLTGAAPACPITDGELRELQPSCLKHFDSLLEPGDEGYQDGLAWGRAPLESRAVLLIPVPPNVGVGGFWVFDYVRDWVDDVGADLDPRLHTVLEATWHFVVRQAVPTEALAIGLVAHKWGNLDAAKEAWTKAADSKLPRRYLEQPFA